MSTIWRIAMQNVTDQPHNKRHILNQILSKGFNIWEVVVTDIALFDHYCILFKETDHVILNKGGAEVIRKCYIDENPRTLFSQAFTASLRLPSASVDNLGKCFSIPVLKFWLYWMPLPQLRPKFCQSGKSNHREITPLVKKNKKRVFRRAERRWLKMKLQIHYMYKDKSLH